MNIKIIQISAVSEGGGDSIVYGLGEDQKVYYWSYSKGEWVLNQK